MIDEVINSIKAKNPPQDGDYIGNDGFLYCGKCAGRKEKDQEICGKVFRVPVICQCRVLEIKAEKEQVRLRKMQSRINQLISEGVYEPGFADCTFERDDKMHPKVSNLCTGYVKHWYEMLSGNKGLMFYGPKGTGKSFYAYAIANSLIAKGIPVCITSFPRILNAAASLDNRQKVIDRVNNCGLLVLDDIGAERNSDFSIEQMYTVINGRYGVKKPLIVTTNYDVETFSNPSDIAYGRIYDRILEMCPVQIKIAGESRRTAIASKQRDEFVKILEE